MIEEDEHVQSSGGGAVEAAPAEAEIEEAINGAAPAEAGDTDWEEEEAEIDAKVVHSAEHESERKI